VTTAKLSPLARDIAFRAPHLSLRGAEAYEGVFGNHPPAHRETLARGLVGQIAALAQECAACRLFADGPVVLTAAGTEFFDIAASGLLAALPGVTCTIVIRSGCYLTHDHLSFERMFQQLLRRSPQLEDLTPGLTLALEVWAAVQSQPESGLAFCTMGKRDVSYDVEMPAPVHWSASE
jgi:D-serine dehydratase